MPGQKVAQHMHHHARCVGRTAFLQQVLNSGLLVVQTVLLPMGNGQQTAPVHGNADQTQTQHGLQSQRA